VTSAAVVWLVGCRPAVATPGAFPMSLILQDATGRVRLATFAELHRLQPENILLSPVDAAAALTRDLAATMQAEGWTVQTGREYEAWLDACSDPSDCGQAGEGAFSNEYA
jgi:hypothetical protein